MITKNLNIVRLNLESSLLYTYPSGKIIIFHWLKLHLHTIDFKSMTLSFSSELYISISKRTSLDFQLKAEFLNFLYKTDPPIIYPLRQNYVIIFNISMPLTQPSVIPTLPSYHILHKYKQSINKLIYPV